MFSRTKADLRYENGNLCIDNAGLRSDNKLLRDELAAFKAGENGVCVQGKHCFHCAHALGSGSIVRTFTDDRADSDWVIDGPICSKMLPCKSFERKQAGSKPTTDAAKEG